MVLTGRPFGGRRFRETRGSFVNIELALVKDGLLRLDRPRAAQEPLRKEHVRLGIYLSLMVADVACILLALTTAAALRLGYPFDPQVGNMLAVMIPLYLVIAMNGGAYTTDVLTDGRRSASRAAMAALVSMTAVLGVAFYLKLSTDMSRMVMGGGMVGAIVLLALQRPVSAKISSHILGGRATSEILICDGVDMPAGWRHATSPVIDAQEAELAPCLHDPVMLDRLDRSIYCYDRVIIACPPERRRAWALALKGSGVNVELFAPELDDIGTLSTARHLGTTTAVVACGTLGLRDRAMERALDLAIVAPLLPFLLPLFGLVMLAIKLETPGPIFFVQHRVGRGNRMFAMYKFRSMRHETLDYSGTRSVRRDDDRVTRVGRFLRMTSIDELPQLLNILKGDMSVVGPRPHAIASTADNALFWEVDDRYWNRHAAKPGLTGLAQVRGFRGTTLTRSDLTNRLQADLEYVAGWTLWRDIAIICRTFLVITHRNAF